MQPALAYLARRKPVSGWLERADGLAWIEINALQTRAGLTANLLEIGAYRGRSAILLGYLRQPGELLFVCDTFDDQPALAPESGGKWVDGKRSYPELTQKTFEDNFARFHAEAPVVLKCPSNALREAGLVAGPLRLVHVDGCFEPEVLAQDLDTVHALLAEGGVAIVEDDHSMHNPGVAPGVLAAIDAGEFRPLCMTPWKIYLTKGADGPGLRAGLTDWAAASGEVQGVASTYRGHEILLLYPVSRRGPSRALDRKAGLAH